MPRKTENFVVRGSLGVKEVILRPYGHRGNCVADWTPVGTTRDAGRGGTDGTRDASRPVTCTGDTVSVLLRVPGLGQHRVRVRVLRSGGTGVTRSPRRYGVPPPWTGGHQGRLLCRPHPVRWVSDGSLHPALRVRSVGGVRPYRGPGSPYGVPGPPPNRGRGPDPRHGSARG